jgi:hypothetical protein
MKTRRALATAIIGVQLFSAFGVGIGVAGASAGTGATAEAAARAVVARFFQTINDRQFDKTCALMSARFYRTNHIPDRKRCVLGLTVGVGTGPHIFFRVLGVRIESDRASVRTLANGVAGTIVLIKETGSFKVLSVAS